MKRPQPVLVRTAIALAVTLALMPVQAGSVSWIGMNGGYWDLDGNWSPGLPGAGDDVLLGASSSEFRTSSVTIRSFNGTGSLTISGGALTSLQASSIGSLTLANGSLGGAGTVSVGNLTWSGGTLGQYGVANGAVTVSGATTISGAQSNYLYYGGTLNLHGTTTWTAGNNSVFLNSGGQGATTLNIGAGTTFTDAGTLTSNDSRSLGYYADGVINNAGTYARNGVGTTSLTTFNNTGALQINAGTITLYNGGSSAGSLNVAAGATLNFSGGTFDINAGSIANGGTLLVSGGTANLHAGAAYGGSGVISVSSGLLASDAGTTLAASALAVSGGTARFAGTVNLPTLSLANGTLGGAGTVTTGALTWTSGTMGEYNQGGGTTTVNGLTTIDGTQGQQLYYGRTLNLNGNATWSAGNGTIYINTGGQGATAFNIGAGTTFTDGGTGGNDYRQLGYFSDGVINNAGSYVRNGLGSTYLANTVNAGSIAVNAGALYFNNGGTSTGAIDVASGATFGASNGTTDLNGGTLKNNGTLSVTGGTLNINAGAAYSGNGAVSLVGGTLNGAAGVTLAPVTLSIINATGRFAGALNTPTLTLTNGTLSGAGTVTMGSLAWNSGTMGEYNQGGGVTTVTGLAALDGAQSQTLNYGRTLNLNGNTTWSAGNGSIYIFTGGQGATTLNIGAGTTFTDAGTGGNDYRQLGYYSDGLINNAGHYVRNGAGSTLLGTTSNTGSIAVNAGGLYFNNGGNSTGALSVASGATLGTGNGTTDLNGGTLSNGGTLAVAGGTLNINAGLTYSGSGVITVNGGTLNSASGTTLAPGALSIANGTGRFAGNVNTPTLALVSGTLSGPGTVTAGALTWTSGTMGEYNQGGGRTTVDGAAALDGTQNQSLSYGRTLNLNGNTTWSAGNGSVYINSGGQGTSTINIAAGTNFTDAGTNGASDARYLGYYGDGLVSNAGTYTRNGLGTTYLGPIANGGTLTVNAGALYFNNGGTSTGVLNVASGATLGVSNGTLDLNGGTLANGGTLSVTGGVLDVNAGLAYSGNGVITLTGGTLNSAAGTALTPSALSITNATARLAGAATAAALTLANGTLSGAGTVTTAGLTWSGGTMGEYNQGGGTTTVNGLTAIDGTQSQNLIYGRTLNLNGDATWSAGNGSIYAFSSGQGTSTLNIGAGAHFTDGGTATSGTTRYLGYYGDAVINNAGTYTRNGLGTTVLTALNNTGTVAVHGGALLLQSGGSSSGAFTVAAGTTLAFTGGTYNLTGGSLGNAGTTQVDGGAVVVSAPLAVTGTGAFAVNGGTLLLQAGSTLAPPSLAFNNGSIGGAGTLNAGTLAWGAGTLGLSGQAPGSVNVAGLATIDGTQSQTVGYGQALNLNGNATWSAGNGSLSLYSGGQGTSTLKIAQGTTFTDGGTGTDGATRYLGYYGDGVVANAGTYERNGLGITSLSTVNNSGTFNANAGTTRFASLQGTGTLRIGAGAAVDLSNSNATVGNLIHNGGAGGLSIGGQSITVSGDYNNAGFGVGNAFDAVANVVGTGTIVGSNAAQALTGANVTGGTGSSATLTIGNVHVGANTLTYQVANTGTGASLRGAIQTAVNGGSLTDARLSGSGVTASNFGAIAAGGHTGDLAVTYTASTAGVQSALSGQAVHLASNFANVAGQDLHIVLADGAAAYRLAAANTIGPVNFGNVHVGDTLSQTLTLTNTAFNDAYSEKLNASFGGTSDARITTQGAISLLGAGATDSSSMKVNVNTSSAGVVSGTASVLLQSDGSGTSGLGITQLPTQQVGVAANVQTVATVYRLAQASAVTPNPVSFGNVRVNDVTSLALSLTNVSANDGFSERLDASIGGATAGVTAAGSFMLLGAGATDNSSLHVGLDTTSAGVKSGSATITLASDGSGTSGLGNTPLAAQQVHIGGTVYRTAQASIANAQPVVVANQRVGGSAMQALTIANLAANDGFSEQLGASIAAGTGAARASGSVSLLNAGASNNNGLLVGVDTSSAGAKAGTAVVSLQSGGVAGVSGLAAVSTGSQSVGVSGNVYNVAAGSLASPVTLANQRVGGGLLGAVTITNTAVAGAFSEDLNASVGSGSGAYGSGSLGGLVAGANNGGAIKVGLDTSTSGARSGTVTINYQTAGTVGGVSNGLAVASVGAQTVGVSGNVYQAAAGAIQSAALNFGTVQVGQVVTQNLVIRNTATGASGFVEDLNASFGGSYGSNGALIIGSGALNGIVAGSNSTAANGAMTVTVNTASAGVVSGGIVVDYATAGKVNGTSNGLGSAGVGSETYGVAGTIQATANVISQASPSFARTSFDLGATRVGAAAPTASVTLSNVATTSPQAALDASIAGNGAPVVVSGSVNLLAPGAAPSNQLTVGLSTGVAGDYTGAHAGSATVTLVSDAANVGGCAPNCQMSLGSQQITVSGQVYASAVAQLNTQSLDFGIVHVGDSVPTQAISVTNAAAVAGLNDVLTGSISAGGAFTASGSVGGLGAQQTASGSFMAGLNTGTSGVFSGTATASFGSHDEALSDLALGAQQVALKGQVNNYAQGAIASFGPGAALTQNGNVYTLDFGSIVFGSAGVHDGLAVLNSATGLADLLSGSFTLAGVGPEFTLTGFSGFSDIAAGNSKAGFDIGFNSGVEGSFMDSITLNLVGSNLSGYSGDLGAITLVLEGKVTNNAVAVPEPRPILLMLLGLVGLMGVARRRRARAAGAA